MGVTHPACRAGLYISRTEAHCPRGEGIPLWGLRVGAAQEGRVCRILHGNGGPRPRTTGCPRPSARSATMRSRGDPTDSSSRLPHRGAGPTGSGTAPPLPLQRASETLDRQRDSRRVRFLLDELGVNPQAWMRPASRRDLPASGLVMCRDIGKHLQRFCGATALGCNYPRGRQCRVPRNCRIRSAFSADVSLRRQYPWSYKIVESVRVVDPESFFPFFLPSTPNQLS